MKKLLLLSAILFITGILISTTAFVVSGFDIFELTNYNNFERRNVTFDINKDISFVNCDIIEFKEYQNNDSYFTFYENKDVKYNIESINDKIVVTQVGEIKDSIFSNGYGIQVYVSYGSTKASYDFTSEDLFLDMEDINGITNLNINAEDAVISLENIKVDNINIDIEDGVISIDETIVTNDIKILTEDIVLNIDELNCNILDIKSNDGVFVLEDIKCNCLNIDSLKAILTLELPYEKSSYTMNVEVLGVCNVQSGGIGIYLVNIKSNKGVVTVKFD